MRKFVLFLTVALLSAGHGSAQQAAAAPQTARQALIEMFFSKTPGTLVKHLPAVTREALEKSGALANLQQFTLLTSQLQAQGKNFETFETGSLLLSASNPTGEKVELTVESDSLHGDQDDIELSFQTYKDGTVQPMPFKPKFTLSMKQEAQVWKLNEISFMIHLPLTDPEFLKAITEKMKPQANAGAAPLTQRGETFAQAGGSDASVLAAMRTILTAEVTYAVSYPSTGYTCTLSDLDGFGGGQPNEHQAMLINSGLASGKRFGFVFTLSGCERSPATSFHLVAAPGPNTYGRKTFCADQSGTIRSSSDAASCMANGTPVQ